MDVSAPGCSLLSTHDDFSIVSLLPTDVAVLTHLRDPVDRVLSAYEFAVEVGARQTARQAPLKKSPDRIATDDVWPWSRLVPFFAEDVRRRKVRLICEHLVCVPARGSAVSSVSSARTRRIEVYRKRSCLAASKVPTSTHTHTNVCTQAAAATGSASPPIQPQHWVHVTHPDGSKYYYNKVCEGSEKLRALAPGEAPTQGSGAEASDLC